MSDVREGGCRCGQLRFRITAPDMLTMVCHCRGCQRMTGAPFSVSAIVPGGAFEVTAGEPVIGGLHGEVKHYHCPHCLSWVYTIPPTPMPMVNVRATMLDDAIPARHSFPAFPPDDAWGPMVAEYMQRAG